MCAFGLILIDQCKYQDRRHLSAVLFALLFKLTSLAPAPGGRGVPVKRPQAVSGSHVAFCLSPRGTFQSAASAASLVFSAFAADLVPAA